MYFEIQKFIYNALANNTTFMTLIGNRLYDQPNTNEVYPYVILGNGVSSNHLTHGKDGIEESIYITIFTKPSNLGWYPAKNISNCIRSILHLMQFTPDDTKYKNPIVIQDGESREQSGDYRNIDLTYKVILEEV